MAGGAGLAAGLTISLSWMCEYESQCTGREKQAYLKPLMLNKGGSFVAAFVEDSRMRAKWEAFGKMQKISSQFT